MHHREPPPRVDMQRGQQQQQQHHHHQLQLLRPKGPALLLLQRRLWKTGLKKVSAVADPKSGVLTTHLQWMSCGVASDDFPPTAPGLVIMARIVKLAIQCKALQSEVSFLLESAPPMGGMLLRCMLLQMVYS
mmetsp:Transcript_61423/g.146427  ORF Transcript_61423/g.146427 Transcript_61423/m.146427 type:complete len:132 (-) Transcript_61423:50-445(-)